MDITKNSVKASDHPRHDKEVVRSSQGSLLPFLCAHLVDAINPCRHLLQGHFNPQGHKWINLYMSFQLKCAPGWQERLQK